MGRKSGTSGRTPAKAFAVLAVALMMLSVLPMIDVYAPEADAYEGESYNVVYHPGEPGDVYADYNDQTVPSNVEIKYFGTPIAEYNPQFWTDNSHTTEYINGEIQKVTLSNGEIQKVTLSNWYKINQYDQRYTKVFSGWYASDSDGNIISNGSPVDPGDDLSEFQLQSDGKIHLTADWSLINSLSYDINYDHWGGDKYTNILLLTSDIYLSDGISDVTIRSNAINGGTIRTLNLSGQCIMGGSVIVDNVMLSGSGKTTTQDSTGLYAASNSVLIVGTNVSTTQSNGSYVQIVGGPSGWSSNAHVTDVRVFSGTYSNIIGGGTNGFNGELESTSIVLAGTTEVLEAVWGASINGSTKTSNVLIVNGNVDALGYDNGVLAKGFSTIIGGSRFGTTDNTEVVITGLATVFAAQGGGRDTSSYTGHSHIVVSGKATIEHMVCGGLTDGNNSRYSPRVGESTVEVRDSAQVADVYGGGWDLWSNPLYPSTGKTNVVISGGHISGSVYGGGFRGSIGAENQSGVTSTVMVTGGTIDGSVYGGGQGGPDPMADGNKTNTTGRAYVNGDVNVTVIGGTIKNNVYGGGFGAQMVSGDSNISGWYWDDEGGVADTAKVTGNVSVSISGSAVIMGSVYGGGKGLSNSDAQHGNLVSNIAAVLGSVTVNITSGNISGSVFGGGEFGSIDHRLGSGSAPGDITINVGDAIISGDVFAGGLGEAGRLSVYALNRTVTIDGATIHGSVYGGSRLGNDNCTGTGSRLTYGSTTELRIVSVDMSGSGNVYGGGYMGYSFMDTRVLIGIPAIEASGLSNADGFVNIKSVYGGSSIAKPTDGVSDTVLLDGSSYIEIGSHRTDGTTPYSGVWIAGDVFGAGDYCEISGSSEIVFERFSQDISMLSVQKADVVTLIGSSLVLDGNIDGATTLGSEKLSLNRIGHLILSDDSVPSRIEANAAVSISGYTSQYTSGLPEDYSKYNSIRMNGGMLFSILGQGDTGKDVSVIEGHTVLESDSNQYYGAFAIGTANYAGNPVVVDDNTGFYVKQADGNYTPTQTADYSYMVDGDNVVFRVWYISGSYKVEDTLVLKDTGSENVVSGISDVKMPKLLTGSQIVFAGYYVNSDTPDSFDLVDDIGNTNPGSDFTVLVGTGNGSQHTTFNNGRGFYLGFDDSPSVSSSGMILETEVSTNGGFSTTGYVGTITLHFAEVSGGIAVNVYDVEISVYLRAMDGHNIEIYRDIIMRGAGNITGTTDVYLPTLDENRTGEYYITSVNVGGDLTVTPTSTNLNKDGWLCTDIISETYVEDSTDEVSLGVGGVYSPVLRLDYTLRESSDGTMAGAKIVIQMREEGTENFTHTFTVYLNPIKVTQVTITIYDTYLNQSPTSENPWADYSSLLTFGIDYGLTLSKTYVAINTSMIVKGSDHDFINGFKAALYSVNGEVVAGSSSYMDMMAGDQVGYRIVSIPELLAIIPDLKPSTQYSGGTFAYSEHSPRWYQNEMCMAEVNFESKFTKDLGIYAGYSIVVSVKGVVEDGGGFRFVSVTPDVIFSGAPGKTVNLNKMAFTLPTGYEISKWYSQYDKDIGLSSELTDGELTTFSNTTIYLLMVKSDYKLTLVFHYGNSIVSPTYNAPAKYHYGESVEVTGIDLSGTSAENAHIASATGTLEGGGRWTVSVGSDSLSFMGPAGNITVVVYLSDEYHISITMPAGDYDDNTHFTFGEPTLNGTSWSIPISESTSTLGRHDSVQITVGSGGASFHLSTKGMTYHGQSVVFSLYKDGEILQKYINELTVTVGVYDSESEYEIRISVNWEVKFGSGYTAQYIEVDTDGDEGITGDLNNGDTVRTGYNVKLTLNDGYTFGPSFNTQGVSLVSEDPRVYRVVGNSISVAFGNAVPLEYNLTITLNFQDPVPDTLPEGAFALSDSIGVHSGTFGVYAGGSVTVTYILASGAYSWNADYDGFVQRGGNISVNGDSTVSVELQPVMYVIEFYDADGNTEFEKMSGNWDTIIGVPIGSMVGYSDSAWGVYRSMWDGAIGGVTSDDSFDFEDFGGNENAQYTLYLRMIPDLDDIFPIIGSIIVVTESGSINGIHDVAGLVGLIEHDISFTASLNGTVVSVTFYTDGRVLIQNCPIGTGMVVLDLGRGVQLTIVSVAESSDIVQGTFTLNKLTS